MESNIDKIASKVSFYDVAFDDEYGWFCDVYINTLCRIDIKTGSIFTEAMVPMDGDAGFFQYGFIAKTGNILVLAPRSAYTVLLYYIDEKKFRSIELDAERIRQIGAFNLFSGVKIYGNDAYLIPGRFPGIVKIGLYTAEITYLNDWYAVLRQRLIGFDPQRAIFARCNCSEGNKMYLPCWQGNIIMIFDLETEEYSFLELTTYDAALSGISVIGNELWTASRISNIIVRINKEGKEIDRIEVEGIEDTGVAFLARCGQLLYVVPMYGDKLVCLDLETRENRKICNLVTEAINVPDELIFAQNNMLSCVKDSKERIWMYSIFDGKIYRCDANEKLEIYSAVLEKKEDIRRRNRFYMKVRLSENILWENNQLRLEDFLGGFLKE